MPTDYNATINLPKTDFPMRAGLPKREPEMLAEFYKKDIYGHLMEKNEGKPLFILHDGPPFSNGDIHIGTAMNKILKDFIVRYKNMTGFKSPYVPGWDNHGMPIESAIIKKNKLDRKNMSIPQFRDACRAFAEDFVGRQRTQFKRLGVIGDWDRPYRTMDPAFEAREIRVFGKMYEAGYIYKGLKPVYWCPSDETALAEAEIEYADDPCTSIYVKFRVKDDKGVLKGVCDPEKTYFIIWTTTTWTLPGNLAISLGPDFEYAVVKAGEACYIVAADLVDDVMKKGGVTDYTILKKIPGRSLELAVAQHPFYDRESLVIVGDHVTIDTGTGCVHTAPGFGVDDFNVCRNYPQIPFVAPVNGRGVMTEEALQYAGIHYTKANEVILEDLKKSGALFAEEKIVHSYPHCWRCKNPIIFRATEQWFASVDAIKETAVAACEDIKWNPEWGKERMIAMIRERNDWCISRQRHWGLPIPVFYCGDCKKPVCTSETIDAVAGLFAEKGSNVWFEAEAVEILPAGYKCPHCGGTHFTKETDTLDGWFDSGSTHAAVLDKVPGLRSPADVYLEGGDQYRGWFQSSMLTSIAVKGAAPYKQIITHGWTVDGEGKAMHKSLGNAVSPDEVIKDYGADILRLWVASTDYRADMRISKDILKQLSDIYLKIRNTARFILGNLDGFDPDDAVPFEEMPELDKWAVIRFNRLIERVRASFDKYEYHTIYHGVHNFCAVEMSNIYLDIIKDRLYCDGTASLSRKSAQSAVYLILDGIVRLIAPILAFTAEEIWAAMPHRKNDVAESVLYNDMPRPNPAYDYAPGQESKWDKLLALRADVNKALEVARAGKVVGKPLDAEITLYLDETGRAAFEEIKNESLKDIFIVSKVDVAFGAGTGYETQEFKGARVEVRASQAPRCVRCWTHDDRVGESADHPELCPRCRKAVKER
ncbi:Isoleucyl-tRNA synthetase [Sporobacter termitidis DSM 10068]|uniref:Isoleucine--tRNA ligase n=1 Tax=Sporobacter termitidis DSM 10068 TaxID=1123282 RepID=A0A1M5Z7L7_9FIRM|nr:isoleucine--tRNA ligase [Sporobacter termitidis]SHI20088.1 Isoleucyl-tRNA synthetase [Sporobacter termitidis DSM 10068]